MYLSIRWEFLCMFVCYYVPYIYIDTYNDIYVFDLQEKAKFFHGCF